MKALDPRVPCGYELFKAISISDNVGDVVHNMKGAKRNTCHLKPVNIKSEALNT